MIFRIGLTGGLASGKSTVARRLRKRGIPVLDADAVVRDLYLPDRPGAHAIAREFGRQFLNAEGAVDRAALAAHVFKLPETVAVLNQLIHPLVYQEQRHWFEKMEAASETAGVIEATLLFESGGKTRYDYIITVSAAQEIRLARAVHRSPGMDREDLERRLDAQWTDAAREAQADEVIRNDGSLEDLEAEADRLAAVISDRASRHRVHPAERHS